jgi:hypothetical protein
MLQRTMARDQDFQGMPWRRNRIRQLYTVVSRSTDDAAT